MTKSTALSPVHAITPHRSALTLPGLHLSHAEKIVAIVHADSVIAKKRQRAISPLLSLMKLTDGFTKPSRAATVTKENKGVAALNLYDAFFPRDAHIVAYFLRESHPELTEATVMECLRSTGVKDNLRGPGLKDEQEVGKVPHEIRDGQYDPIARKLSEEKDWGWPYFGAVDTTGKNINAIAFLAKRRGGLSFLNSTYQGRDGEIHTVEDGLHTHINWLRKRMDLNPEGVIECLWVNPKHHANQTWADSVDAFHHKDGSWPAQSPKRNLGIAVTELQAETYDALMNTADIYKLMLKNARGQKKTYLENEIEDLTLRAATLRRVVLRSFWVKDSSHFGGFFARGTDRGPSGQLRPLAIRSSDMGHLLNSRLLDGTEPDVVLKREAVVKNLFSADMLCPNGIRTISADSVRYYKDKYHNGTSWPWVTYYIALGLERHGYYGLARDLEKRVMSLYKATKLLPEYGSGSANPLERLVTDKVIVSDSTAPEKQYTICQPAQEVQAWTAAAVLGIKYEGSLYAHHSSRAIPLVATDEQKRRFEQQILHSLVQ